MKNKDTGAVYFVVVLTLLLKEDVEKEEAEEARKAKATNTDLKKSGGDGDFQPSANDLD